MERLPARSGIPVSGVSRSETEPTPTRPGDFARSRLAEALGTNREDAEEALAAARDLDSGEAVDSLFERLGEQSPRD